MKLLNAILIAGLMTVANAQMVDVTPNIIKDTKTNLLWQDTQESKEVRRTYNEALTYCSNLEIDGKKGWKVPGFGELFSIVDTKVYNPTLSKKFKHFVPDNYWTTKTFSHGMSKEAFVVDFKSGAFNRKLMEDKYFVRCYKK